MNYGKQIKIFMTDGTEYGPRTAEIGNWSGKGLYSTLNSMKDILKRDEMNQPGVYFLKSVSTDDAYSEKIYIGEAENLATRMKQHLYDENKEFSEIVCFIGKELTKAHIKYLESRCVLLAIEAKTAQVENGNKPNLPRLHEADISDMEYFISQIKLVLPLMGFTCLIPSVISVQPKATIVNDEKSVVYKLKSKEIDAHMYVASEGFIVVKGSKCNKTTLSSLSGGWAKRREALIHSSVLVDSGKYYEFTEDTVFSSISAASSIILGIQTQGPVYWIDENGRTYKENNAEQ